MPPKPAYTPRVINFSDREMAIIWQVARQLDLGEGSFLAALRLIVSSWAQDPKIAITIKDLEALPGD